MKFTQQNQQGFSVVEAVIILVIAAGVGLAGYKVYQHSHSSQSKGQAANSSAPSATSFPAKITSTNDVKQASKALEAQQIKTKLNPTQLDQYVKSLL